jgi:glycerol-3-phosphate dehydrogenase
LPGGEAGDLEEFRRSGMELGIPAETVEHVLSHFGTEAAAVFNLAREDRTLLEPLDPEHPAIRAEVIHSVRRELALTVEDMLVRRIHLYYEARDHGMAAAEPVAELMAKELGWPEEERNRQVEQYRSLHTQAN